MLRKRERTNSKTLKISKKILFPRIFFNSCIDLITNEVKDYADNELGLWATKNVFRLD